MSRGFHTCVLVAWSFVSNDALLRYVAGIPNLITHANLYQLGSPLVRADFG